MWQENQNDYSITAQHQFGILMENLTVIQQC